MFFVQKDVCKTNWTLFVWRQVLLVSLSKRIRPLIKPLLKNSFSTNFQGTGPWGVQFTLVDLFSGFTIAANIIFLFLFLFPSSSSLSISLSPFLFLSIPFSFSLSFSDYTFNKQHKVEKVTQSICWTPLTTSATSTTSTTNITSSSAKNSFN